MKKIFFIMILFILFLFSCDTRREKFIYIGKITDIISVAKYKAVVEVDDENKIIINLWNSNPGPKTGDNVYNFYHEEGGIIRNYYISLSSKVDIPSNVWLIFDVNGNYKIKEK